jgi:hypothetical protein
MRTTTTTRFDLSSGSLYLPYASSDLSIRDNEGNTLEIRGLEQRIIQDAILDNVSSRRWTDDAERKAQHLAFALKLRDSVEGLISALQPEPVAAGGSDA